MVKCGGGFPSKFSGDIVTLWKALKLRTFPARTAVKPGGPAIAAKLYDIVGFAAQTPSAEFAAMVKFFVTGSARSSASAQSCRSAKSKLAYQK